MADTDMKTAALGYAMMGLPVIPLRPRGKIPLGQGWTKAETDLSTVTEAWERQPDANIGLRMGNGLIDIETDKKPNCDGAANLRQWAKDNGVDLSGCWAFRSGGGGVHRVFSCGVLLGNRAGVLPGVDVRGEGGQSVVPPSIHPNGRRYEWLPGQSPFEIPSPAPVPFGLYALLLEGQRGGFELPAEIPEGERNGTLFRLGAKARGLGLTADEIADLLTVANSRCTAPLDDAEVSQIARQAARYERGTLQRSDCSLVSAAEVEYRPPRWVMEPYLQIGKGTLIQGDPGVGKTAFVCALAAAISTGTPIIGHGVQKPGPVLMLSVEDDLAILRGRIESNGGDLSKCFFLANAAGLTFSSPEVEEAIAQTGATVVVFDPLQAFLGAGVDMHRSNETRPVLAALFELCDRHGCACVLVAHLGKAGKDKSAVTRSLGSVDIPAAMRSVLHICRDPQDRETRLAVHVKSSNAQQAETLAYTIGERGRVQWQGQREDFTEDHLTEQPRVHDRGLPYDAEPLVEVLREMASRRYGFWSYTDVKTVGAEVLGVQPFDSGRTVAARLTPKLLEEIKQRDKLIVVVGTRTGPARGVTLTEWRPREE